MALQERDMPVTENKRSTPEYFMKIFTPRDKEV
jgi:hypothetical protein